MFISIVIYYLFFILLNKFNPKLMFLFNKIPEKLKGNLLIRWGVITVLPLTGWTIISYFDFNILLANIIAGFIISF